MDPTTNNTKVKVAEKGTAVRQPFRAHDGGTQGQQNKKNVGQDRSS